MNQFELDLVLEELPLGPVRYFGQIGSTNDEAARWVDAGAPDLGVVVADEQTAGRGRLNRKWFTPPGTALAFSLILRSFGPEADRDFTGTISTAFLPRLTALGALAVCMVLQQDYNLTAQIKWPNDVLLKGKKVAGVLAESFWQGEKLTAAVLGIGVNITPGSVPREGSLNFPAGCVDTALGRPIGREEFMRSILKQLLTWRVRLAEDEFLHTWESYLAFRDEWVNFVTEPSHAEKHASQGLVLGLNDDGSLRLQDRMGIVFSLQAGELRLQPGDG